MKISICGGGWLGRPLARQLMESGHNVVTTSRTAKGAQALISNGIAAITFTLGEALPEVLIGDVLIVNIPPGRKTMGDNAQRSREFVAQICSMLEALCISSSSKLIFVSTSAVYGDTHQRVTEKSALDPKTASAWAHVQIEQFISQKIGTNACILRLGGLIGERRHPAAYLAGKEDLPNGKQAVNLVHQVDVIQAIEQIIVRQLWGEVLHLCATAHPSRQAYYPWAAKKMGLIPPTFAQEHNTGRGKILDPAASLQKLGMTLSYPSPYDML
ncbi:MAG: nucleoside-diphosphate-sugar epimerase [Paraglaciecola sp.]|jgi:nucleoside-diphosphate-sugar epimerase